MTQYFIDNKGEYKGLDELTSTELAELIYKEYNKHCVMHRRYAEDIIDQIDPKTRFVYYANMSYLNKSIIRLVELLKGENDEK